MWSRCIFSLFIVVYMVHGYPSGRDQVEETRHIGRKNRLQKADYEVNKKRTESFKCKIPRPVPINSAHEFLRRGENAELYPEFTILNRCNDSCGLCYGKKCGPIKSKPVELVFWKVHQSKGEYARYAGQNHTLCACIDHNDISPK